MHYTIELLVKGDGKVVDHYAEAISWWKTILADSNGFDVERLSKIVTAEQISFFEHQCGGRYVGQEIMVLSGIAQFYTTQDGFEWTSEPHPELDNREKAMRVYKAFMRSYCSMEIKQIAEEVARDYDLLEERL